ncbi:hypothetical protein ISF_05071 [Cordyceps fumosorosea ARSEF 2679]|uniref:Uncharacterized protein n=1 Tax=Cordyceps fumosorosea (strain ARSEF 2679) TaxID=1081104 RepID=A0A167W0V3_CORFA|nr:hypothetical protein ISF_05071 [Cordyceps fumosorosea ARSEF 2679]OAA63195.1 hypothetical protein ISF_05071 [Cordyceps fumosorosea ARSEF 2679]
MGARALNGECLAATLCGDSKTVCSGDTPQCTVNDSVYVDDSSKVLSNFVCCPSTQKALNGKCYPGDAPLTPCYQAPGVCDWGKGYYCAWNEGNADSRCCKFDEYFKGNNCVKKA